MTPDQVYNRQEIGKLIAATAPGTIDRVFVMALAFLGLRIGEALALTWPAIDLKAGTLSVLLTSGGLGQGARAVVSGAKNEIQPPYTGLAARAYPRVEGVEAQMPAELARVSSRHRRGKAVSPQIGEQDAR